MFHETLPHYTDLNIHNVNVILRCDNIRTKCHSFLKIASELAGTRVVYVIDAARGQTTQLNIPLFLFFSLHTSILAINMTDLLQSSNPAHIAQTCETYSITPIQFNALYTRAVGAKSTAYCPYSQFQVGATILTEDDQYIDGANVENASYPVGTCAERVAFGKAVTEGHKKFKAVAVATNISPPASPCGMCRQL
jgi:homotetrameric cytidine deaminase